MEYCKRKGVMCDCLGDNKSCNSDNCYRDLPDVVFTVANPNSSGLVIGKIDNSMLRNSLYIDCENIFLHQNGIDIKFDLHEDKLKNIKSISLNGFKFVSADKFTSDLLSYLRKYTLTDNFYAIESAICNLIREYFHQ